MNDKTFIMLREQLCEDLMCWRESNDLPAFVDEELCDIVINAMMKAETIEIDCDRGHDSGFMEDCFGG